MSWFARCCGAEKVTDAMMETHHLANWCKDRNHTRHVELRKELYIFLRFSGDSWSLVLLDVFDPVMIFVIKRILNRPFYDL
jgi:hypothetical protein